MMPRNEASSKWYIPLVAGTEVVRLSDGLTAYDPGTLVPTLPATPPWQFPGLALWLDAAATSSTRTMPDGKVYRWNDLSGLSRHATQPIADRQPQLIGTPGVQF